MPERIKFTKKAIEALESPKKTRRYVYDTVVPGLCICVTENGTKTYYRYGRVYNRPTRLKIGRHPAWTVEMAREECKRLTGEIAARKNPREIKRVASMTLGELSAWVIENHSKPNKRTWQRDQRQYELTLKQWGGRQITHITSAEIREHHVKLANDRGVYAANKMHEFLRLLFRIAIANGWAETDPTTAVPRARTRSRKRFLSPEEIGPFLEAVNQLSDTPRDFFLTCLYTGARRQNVQTMRWDELDLEHGVWLIPQEKAKGGEPIAVVLVESVVEMLRVRRLSTKSEWVFPGRSRKGHFNSPKASWKKVLQISGIKNLRLHDLRRTLGSWQARLGASLPVIGDSLGHKSINATQVYARLDLEPVRASVSRAVEAMQTASEKKHK